ncbi:hypothetical protein [Propionivibrio dicarboxylicus]|uniref:Uncharacterized protein n=1 Tax=Propionivibrio dicarboxylicus TaxID=83767 RepID=A0A1G8LD01_9RHOO|nr:hypothetical protein [Propionivibrio dicarboxylicus]SDI53100.1 hypothetical protein SAMN05660652_03595 [Propionivibrio dicarboxylicus]
MDIQAVKDWGQVICWIVNFFGLVWVILERRNDKTNERVTQLGQDIDEINQKVIKMKAGCDGCQIDSVASRIEQIDRDVSGLKAAAGSAPSHDDLSRVYEAINELAEKVNHLVGESEGQGQTLRQILARIIEKGMP